MKRLIVGLTAVVVLVAAAGQAQAAVITFDAFPLGPLTGGTEAGFTIVATNANVWAPIYGFPTRSVGSASPNTMSTYTFTSQFQFNGLDLVFPGFSGVPGPVIAQGFVGATLVGTDTFSVPVVPQTPTSYSSVNLAGLNLDSLVLSTTSNTSQTTLIDNVSLTPTVPEPSTLAIWGILGCLGMIAVRRRRKQVA